MAATQDDLERIEKAIRNGVTSVKFADRQVTYRSLDEMMRVREQLRRELGLSKKTRRSFANFSKGLK